MTDSKAEIDAALTAADAMCKERGERLTRRRRRVLELALSAPRPLTAYDLLDLLKPEDPAATAVGVYRCLEFLMELGLVHRIETTRAFIGCLHPDHPHPRQFLICRRCGTTVETEDAPFAAAALDLSRRLGFTAATPTVELTGICAECS